MQATTQCAIAAVILEMAEDGSMIKENRFSSMSNRFRALTSSSRRWTSRIDPANPLRMAIPEKEAL